MQLKLDITSKGLILISIPIVSELLLVFVLVVLVNRADAIALAEHREKAFVMAVHEVGMQVYEELNILIAYYTSRQPKLLERFAEIDQNILTNLQNIDTSLSLASDQKSAVLKKNFRNSAENLVKEIRLCRESLLIATDNPAATNWLGIADNTRASAAKFLKASDALMLLQTRSDGSTKESQVKSARDLVRYALMVSVCINILMALYLTLFFSRTISTRVNWICDNIKCIPAGSEMKKQLDGYDELAVIDQFVHSVDLQLKEKDEQRNAILSMVGHDLRSPLSAAQMTLQVMERGGYGEMPDTAKTRLKSTVAVLDTLTRMIRDLLDTETLRAGKFDLHMKQVDLQDICEQARTALLPLAESRRLSIDTHCTSIEGSFDGDRILQVLNNLIGNAVKFSPPQSVITMSLTRENNNALIKIADQGPGISPDEIGKVFERYYQTGTGKRIVGSMGLGLHICKEIVTKHGGRISVESEQDKGTCFRVELPLVNASDLQTL